MNGSNGLKSILSIYLKKQKWPLWGVPFLPGGAWVPDCIHTWIKDCLLQHRRGRPVLRTSKWNSCCASWHFVEFTVWRMLFILNAICSDFNMQKWKSHFARLFQVWLWPGDGTQKAFISTRVCSTEPRVAHFGFWTQECHSSRNCLRL